MVGCIRFAVGVRMGMGSGMGMVRRMHMYPCMHSMMLTNMGIDVVSGSMASISRAVREIPQQRSDNEVYQPDQEAPDKHK